MSNVKDNQKKPSESVDKEVQKLFRKKININTMSVELEKLRMKFNDDDLVNEIQKIYLEKHNKIIKRAKKFAELIRLKYGNTQYPFHVLLEKAKAFKTKHNLSEDEFVHFQRIYEEELVGLKSNDIIPYATNMSKVLGGINVSMSQGTMKLNDSDYKHMQEILKLNATSKALHAQVLLQSLQYSDCDYEAITGKYVRSHEYTPGDHIHPVLVAMFLPKLDILDNHFLRSNLSSIVKARYNNEPLVTKHDYELFHALSKDPNDVVCDNKSSVLDLLNRSQIQNQLWNCVLSLRNGQYYNTAFREFINSVDMCKYNKQDNPDLIYGRYDGTIIKRILSCFSFRPTVVAITPILNNVILNPYQQNIRPVVTTVPMINLRLPPALDNNVPVIDLLDALDQSQYMFDNGVITPRQTSIIYSQGVLFFFVDRRSNMIRMNETLQPFNVAKFPIAVAGFERLNEREVDFKTSFKIRDDEYKLRSVVVAEVNTTIPNQKNIVIGSSTLIMCHSDTTIANIPIIKPSYLKYDPYSVIKPDRSTNVPRPNDSPIIEINELPGLGGEDFSTLARTRGIIFMYELVVDNTNGDIPF